MSNSTPRAALPPLPLSAGYEWRYHGNAVNAFNAPGGAEYPRAKWDHDGYWARKGFDRVAYYTAEQVEQIRRETVQACAQVCQALDNPENSPEYREGAAWCAQRILALEPKE